MILRKEIRIFVFFAIVLALLGASVWWAWRSYVTEPPYVDLERFPVRGVDVSSHNGMMNLNAAAGDGISFVWIKASEGTDFHDGNFAINYNKARHAGLRTGAYHYFRFDKDGVSQGVNFLRAVNGRKLDMGLAVDVEDAGNAVDVPVDSVVVRLQQMLEFLNLCGYRVTFYSNSSGYEKYLIDSFRGFPLWICSFNRENAMNPDWTFWQYDHHGSVSGIRGDVDLNVFRGSREEWEVMFGE
jgi:glycosyl hydrolases family 25